MIFKGLHNQSVVLLNKGYQFPDIKYDEYDSNWLNIYIKVESQQGNWEATDPSLTTFELQSLIYWFQRLANNKAVGNKHQRFTEPNLSWLLLNHWKEETKIIRMQFDLESRPQPANEDINYFVDFEANQLILIEIANELEKELLKYPLRA